MPCGTCCFAEESFEQQFKGREGEDGFPNVGRCFCSESRPLIGRAAYYLGCHHFDGCWHLPR